MALKVQLVPGFADNYFFLVTCLETNTTAVVDPGATAPILAALCPNRLQKILCTHHHGDHIGGLNHLARQFNCPVLASAVDVEMGRIPAPDAVVALKDGDKIHVGNAEAEILFVPGHTLGHIAYYFAKDKILFCGDTLFVGGCGRLFEGTPEQMFESLQRLASLPADTRVFCAHEYTESSFEFSSSIAPEDPIFKQRYADVRAQHKRGEFTVPTTIGMELASNIFLRAETAQDFAELRLLKDNHQSGDAEEVYSFDGTFGRLGIGLKSYK